MLYTYYTLIMDCLKSLIEKMYALNLLNMQKSNY